MQCRIYLRLHRYLSKLNVNSHQHVGILPGKRAGKWRKEHRALVAHLLEGATAITVAFGIILAVLMALH